MLGKNYIIESSPISNHKVPLFHSAVETHIATGVKEREQIDEEHKKLKYEYDGQQAQLLGLQEVLLATKQQLQDMQGKGYEVSVSQGWGWNHNDNQHTHIGIHHVHDV
uniref:Uncharacterized protein n=1 Tax=Timema shepardi TaxID=629360 RepID=A0A7R9FZ73_TIMSH|nr:unnamed protein product [Timema shepardi]